MKHKALSTLLVGAVLSACTPADQESPFEISEDGVVERTIGASGGTLSSPAGASVTIPAGSMAQSANVTMEPVSPSALGPVDGTVLAGTAFQLEPSGLKLSSPANLELRFDPDALNPSQWLGLGAFQASANGSVPLNQVSGDLTSGILKTQIDEFGTVALRVARDLVIPVAGEPAGKGGPIPAGIGLQNMGDIATLETGDESFAFRISCGWKSPSRNACVGTGQDAAIQLLIPNALMEQYPNLGAVISEIDGQLIFENGHLTASLRIDLSVRALIGRSLTSQTVTFNLASGSLGSFDKPTKVPYTIRGNKITFETADGELTLDYTAMGDLLELVLRPDQEFVIKDRNGIEQSYRVAVVARLRKS